MRLQWYLKQTTSSLDSSWTLIVSLHGCNYQYFNHILYRFYCRPWDRARASSAGNCPEPSLCVKTGRRGIIQCLGWPVWPVSATVMVQTRMTGFLTPSINEDRRRRALLSSDEEWTSAWTAHKKTKKIEKESSWGKETGEEAGKIKPEIAGAQRARNVGDSVLTVDAYAIWSGQPTKWREFPTFGQKLNWYASLY